MKIIEYMQDILSGPRKALWDFSHNTEYDFVLLRDMFGFFPLITKDKNGRSYMYFPMVDANKKQILHKMGFRPRRCSVYRQDSEDFYYRAKLSSFMPTPAKNIVIKWETCKTFEATNVLFYPNKYSKDPGFLEYIKQYGLNTRNKIK